MKKVRIGSGLGFYGDSWRPIRASLERGDVQYIGSDHLAELSLAILGKDRQRDQSLGFTKDIVPMMNELWPIASQNGVKFILSAGGLNPDGARKSIIQTFREKGWNAKIATVTGDSIFDEIDYLLEKGEHLRNMDTDEELSCVRNDLLFANAYIGAKPIVEALELGADIIITGRIADAALFLGPLVYELGWDWNHWDRIASGLTIGHLLECSGQASGGNFGSAGEWAKFPDMLHIGYPIAEVSEDGTAIIQKAPNTGGRVSFDTVRQQLLYEVHNPHEYFSPDVVLDMGQLKLDDLGSDRVKVSGAIGMPRPNHLKVVAGYHDGWMGIGSVGFSWPDAYKKCEASANTIQGLLKEQGIHPEEINIEYVGYNSLLGQNANPKIRDELNECFLRMTVRTKEKRVADNFGRMFPWLGLSGPPYMGGYHGIERAKQRIGVWPTLVNRDLIEPNIKVTVEDI